MTRLLGRLMRSQSANFHCGQVIIATWGTQRAIETQRESAKQARSQPAKPSQLSNEKDASNASWAERTADEKWRNWRISWWQRTTRPKRREPMGEDVGRSKARIPHETWWNALHARPSRNPIDVRSLGDGQAWQGPPCSSTIRYWLGRTLEWGL